MFEEVPRGTAASDETGFVTGCCREPDVKNETEREREHEMIKEVSKSDWKLFRQKIGDWQESYMERLTEKYMKMLSSDEPASIKFWKLDEWIRKDKRKPGVQLELKKSEVGWDLAKLINDKVITFEDISEFSEDMQQWVRQLAKIDMR